MPQENNSTDFSSLFNEALALQQEKKWDESLSTYQKIADEGLNTLSLQQASVLYHNMSSVAYEKADLLKAYVWSKKAVHLNPANSQAKDSFAFYSSKIEIPHISHQVSSFRELQKSLAKVPADIWSVLSLVFVLLTLHLFLKSFVSDRKNKAAGNFEKKTPWLAYSFSFVSVVLVIFSIISYLNSSKILAVVIADKAQVQTAPGENKSVIFEAPAGVELEVLASQNNFVQVSFPGAFSGWVERQKVEILSLSY